MALTDNLVAYWTLDTNSNELFGKNGSDTSMSYGTGKLNGCANFNGSNYITVSHNAAFNFTTAFSFSCWMKSSTLQTNKYIFAKPKNPAISSNGWDLNTGSASNKLRVILVGLTPNTFETTAVIYDGNWWHIAMVFNGSNVKLWLNNILRINTNTTGAIETNANDLILGRLNSVLGLNFTGDLDELAMWNRALSAEEVRDLYSYGSGIKYPFNDKMFF